MNNQKQRRGVLTWWWIAGLVVVMAVVILQPWNYLAANQQPQSQNGAGEESAESLFQNALVEQGAILNQTLHYVPCGHRVQRRVDAPMEVIGMDRKAVENAMPDYRITAYSGKEVAMQRDLPIFCPAHYVLLPDSQGELAVWQNELGEEMVLIRGLGIGVEDVPEGEQEVVRIGKPFDTLEELEGWLESADS